jgi:electron transport complex protein RnfE
MRKWDIFLRGLILENPVLIIMIGLCPALATSGTVRDGLGMGVAASFVLVCSNIIISMIRRKVPNEVRIPVFIVVISTFVTIVDYSMQAYEPDLYRALGVFVPLIVVNCVVLGRAEAFAQKNSVIDSTLDGLGMGLGFTLTLVVMATIREILGHGTFLGHPVFGQGFTKSAVTFMILPPGAFLVIAVLKGLINRFIKKESM